MVSFLNICLIIDVNVEVQWLKLDQSTTHKNLVKFCENWDKMVRHFLYFYKFFVIPQLVGKKCSSFVLWFRVTSCVMRFITFNLIKFIFFSVALGLLFVVTWIVSGIAQKEMSLDKSKEDKWSSKLTYQFTICSTSNLIRTAESLKVQIFFKRRQTLRSFLISPYNHCNWLHFRFVEICKYL
jgi:hypothetical protein